MICTINLAVSFFVIASHFSLLEQEDTREVINITEVNAKLETLITDSPIKLAKSLEIRPEKCNNALIIRPEKCDLNEENT